MKSREGEWVTSACQLSFGSLHHHKLKSGVVKPESMQWMKHLKLGWEEKICGYGKHNSKESLLKQKLSFPHSDKKKIFKLVFYLSLAEFKTQV